HGPGRGVDVRAGDALRPRRRLHGPAHLAPRGPPDVPPGRPRPPPRPGSGAAPALTGGVRGGPPRTRRRTARCVPASLGPGAVGRAPARVSAEVRMRGAAGALGAGRGDAPRPSGVQGPGAGPDPLPTGAAES